MNNPHCLNDGKPCNPNGNGGCTSCDYRTSPPAQSVTCTRSKVEDQLERIAQHFVSGSKLTLVVRQTDKSEQDFILTNDDIDQVIAALEMSKYRKPA